jgi:predicted MPP superfamily phosphohydrolase
LSQNATEALAFCDSSQVQPISRRRFLATGLCGGSGLALYSGEIERHWIEITRPEVRLQSLPSAFDGLKIAQLSDIHLNEFTEPFLLRHAIDQINRMQPDVVLLTGDYVSYEIGRREFSIKSAWQCAEILSELGCPQRYAILGNHDVKLGRREVSHSLSSFGIQVLNNTYQPLERANSRIWLVGLDDPVCGYPDPETAIPISIRNVTNEPLIVMCHAPDYGDTLVAHPAGKSVGLMLSGHTHGGQVRLPLVGALDLPPGGRRYVEGRFRLGFMQLYVNRGIGTVGVPFRLGCPPEITLITLRAA